MNPVLRTTPYAQRTLEENQSYQEWPSTWCQANYGGYRCSFVALAAKEKAPVSTWMCAAIPFITCCSTAQPTAPSVYATSAEPSQPPALTGTALRRRSAVNCRSLTLSRHGFTVNSIGLHGYGMPNAVDRVDFNHNTVEIGKSELHCTSLLLAAASFQYGT
jgi:hypothetical protein